MIYAVLSVISGICWSMVYILMILKGHKDKTYCMPFFALAFNIAWEVIFGVMLGGEINIQRIINIIWSLLDVVLLFQFFKYGKQEFLDKVKKFFVLWSVVALGIAFAVIFAFKHEFNGYMGAQYAAFLQNLLMSVLFIKMFFDRKSLHGQSIWIAIFKTIGTLMPTLMVIIAKSSNLLIVLGVSIFVYDLVYITLLYKTQCNKEWLQK